MLRICVYGPRREGRVGVINVDTYYHTDNETPDKVPWTGLGAVTRAFAKIIDDVNKVEIKDLEPIGKTGEGGH
jgi:hypothetical protein